MATGNTHTKKLAKIGRVVFEFCEWTDRHRQTDILITILRIPPWGEVIMWLE